MSVRRGARAHFAAYHRLHRGDVLLHIEDPIETTRNLSDVLRAGRGAALQEAMREISARGPCGGGVVSAPRTARDAGKRASPPRASRGVCAAWRMGPTVYWRAEKPCPFWTSPGENRWPTVPHTSYYRSQHKTKVAVARREWAARFFVAALERNGLISPKNKEKRKRKKVAVARASCGLLSGDMRGLTLLLSALASGATSKAEVSPVQKVVELLAGPKAQSREETRPKCTPCPVHCAHTYNWHDYADLCQRDEHCCCFCCRYCSVEFFTRLTQG